MKPNARKENDAKFKLRRFKTIGDIMHFDPTSRFLFRMGSHRNRPNPNNIRASKSLRPPGIFQALRAFKSRYTVKPETPIVELKQTLA